MDENNFQFAEHGPRIYCGKSNILPAGYDEMGDRYRCLRKGVGVGIYTIPDEKRKQLLANKKIYKLSSDEIKNIAFKLGISTEGKTDVVLLDEIKDRLTLLQQTI